jgi:hypothetical protein
VEAVEVLLQPEAQRQPAALPQRRVQAEPALPRAQEQRQQQPAAPVAVRQRLPDARVEAVTVLPGGAR